MRGSPDPAPKLTGGLPFWLHIFRHGRPSVGITAGSGDPRRAMLAAEAQQLVARSENRARNRLICAKVQLAWEEKRPEDLIPQLRDPVQMCENEWTRVKQLYDVGGNGAGPESIRRFQVKKSRKRLPSPFLPLEESCTCPITGECGAFQYNRTIRR